MISLSNLAPDLSGILEKTISMKIYLDLLSTSRKLNFEDTHDRFSLIDSKTPGRKKYFVTGSQAYRTLNKIQELYSKMAFSIEHVSHLSEL